MRTHTRAREELFKERIMLEKELEKKLVQAVKKMGGLCYKFTSPGHTGVPDRITIMPYGKVGFIELKQAGKKPTPNQRLQLSMLKSKGCRVYLVDQEGQIDKVIKDLALGQYPGMRWADEI